MIDVDLNLMKSLNILHIIDHARKFSIAIFVKPKKNEIIEGLITNWISIFGTEGKTL